jgi:lysophospholipase L1-like esterase
MKMKYILSLIFTLFLSVIIFTGCEDKTSLTAPSTPSPKSGNANLTTLVTLGNSLTAGYQNGSLYQSAQQFAYGNLIAKQVGTNFAMPLVSDPGTAGRMEIQSLNLATNQIVIYDNPNSGSPINTTYPLPYNNLGVPGALLYDVVNATNSANCASALYANKPNPLFNLVLRGLGSEFAQAKALHATFIILWIGNNDILGYATSGGVSPYTPTSTFAALYSQLVDSISSIGAKVVVANIPDVTSIPFFTTVGPLIAQKLSQVGISGIYYQNNGRLTSSVASVSDLATGKVLITLPGMNYATLIGKPTGQFYRDMNYSGPPLSAIGIDTTQPFGLTAANPWPDALILDPTEIETAKSTTASYNSTISNLASAKGFALFDVNSFFNQIATSGYVSNGIKFTTTYVLGGLFGLDGVHPTDQGQALLANQFIKTINSSFSANIPLINIATIPNSLLLTKSTAFTDLNIPYFLPGSFDHLLF